MRTREHTFNRSSTTSRTITVDGHGDLGATATAEHLDNLLGHLE